VGQTAEGLAVIAEALNWTQDNEGRYCEAELYRLRGELTLAQSSVQRLESSVQREAEECFLKAIDIARQQQAKSWELRASTSLARLWQHQGKRAEAHKLLSEVYNWFTEGFETTDVQEAKALLAELEVD
jgi:predicted ATPase